MHTNLFVSRVIFRVQKSAEETCKRMGNYIYYRMHSHSHSMAWSMAKKTL